MINSVNLRDALISLGFEPVGQTLVRDIGGCRLEVDLAKKRIRYPEAEGLKVHDQTVCNFAAPENFVVLVD